MQHVTEVMREGAKVTPKKAARLMAVSVKTIYRYLKEGVICGSQPKKHGHIMVYRLSVDRAIREGERNL